jgi:hypothetical protein
MHDVTGPLPGGEGVYICIRKSAQQKFGGMY